MHFITRFSCLLVFPLLSTYWCVVDVVILLWYEFQVLNSKGGTEKEIGIEVNLAEKSKINVETSKLVKVLCPYTYVRTFYCELLWCGMWRDVIAFLVLFVPPPLQFHSHWLSLSACLSLFLYQNSLFHLTFNDGTFFFWKMLQKIKPPKHLKNEKDRKKNWHQQL